MAPGATAASPSTISATPRKPKLLSHINWSPPFPGGTHTPLPLPGRNLAVVADEANAEKCAKGTVSHVRARRARAGKSGADRDAADADAIATSARLGTFGPHNLHENRPGSFQSEETIFATYNNAGVRVFDIKDAFAPKEIASWVPPAPKKLIDPRPNVALAAKTCRCLRDAGRADVCQRLERRHARAAISGVIAAQRESATCPPWPPLPIGRRLAATRGSPHWPFRPRPSSHPWPISHR